MPDWVKIGYTNQTVADRLRELNQPTNLPLSFRVYAILETENAEDVEQCIHKILDAADSELHAIEKLEGGKIRKREFFRMSAENAYTVIAQVQKLLGDSAKLTKVEPTTEEQAEEEIAVETHRSRSPNFSFPDLQIPEGAKLQFRDDSGKEIIVCGDRSVRFPDSENRTSLSAATDTIFGDGQTRYALDYWMYEGKSLRDWKNRR